jgi:outer membrane biosynthesis protein TonB
MQRVPSAALTTVFYAIAAAAQASDAPLIVAESQLTDYWTRTRNEGSAHALYPKAAVRAGASACVAVAFTIDGDGKAQSPKVLSSFISREDADEIRAQFEKSVLENVPHWRYAPAVANDKHQSIYTYVTVTAVAEMGLHSKAFQAEISGHCKVDDFAAPAAGAQQAVEQKS